LYPFPVHLQNLVPAAVLEAVKRNSGELRREFARVQWNSRVSHDLHADWNVWKLHQAVQVKNAICKELDDARDLRKIFGWLIDNKIKRFGTPDEIMRLTTDDILSALPDLVKSKPRKPAKEATPKDALRSQKRRLKERLEIFGLSDEGKRLPMRIHLPERGPTWDLVVTQESPAVKRFWEPYFSKKCKRVHIVYAESVFFRGGKDNRAFIRHMDVNDQEAFEDIRSRWPIPEEVKLQGGLQFVSAGDCAAVIELVQQFERNGVPTRVTKAHLLETPAEEGEGLIVLGNGRIAPWLAQRFRAEKFNHQIDAKRVRIARRKSNPDDDFSVPFVKGIIVRTFSDELNCWLTMIAANHGRFMEASVKYLMSEKSEKELPRLFEKRKWDSLQPVPSRFEIAATVNVDEWEQVKKEPGRAIPLTLE
jgi:plasmid stability protein